MKNRWLMIGIFAASIAWAEGDGDLSNGEAWCDINAANCVCSEPLTATDYVDGSGNWASEDGGDMINNGTARPHNPNDTTSNQCTDSEGTSTGMFVTTYPYKLTPSDTIPGLNGQAYDAASLPNRVAAQAPRFLGFPNPAKGIYFMGHNFADTPEFSSYRGRRAYRWYIYYPDDFVHTASGEQNTKMWQTSFINGYYSQGSLRSISGSSGSNIWSCNGGASTANPLRANMKSHKSSNPSQYPELVESDYTGQWWRYEMVIDQANVNSSDPGEGNGARLRLFAKNVSDNRPELVFIDTYANDDAGLGDDGTGYTVSGSLYTKGPYVQSTDFSACAEKTDIYHAGEQWDVFRQNNYTQSSSDTGTPQKGYAFVVTAAWTQAEMDAAGFDLFGTDAYNKDDFRIGSAYEMEGVAGAIDPNVIRPKPMTDLSSN